MAEPASNYEKDDESPVIGPNLHLYKPEGEGESKKEASEGEDAKIIPIDRARKAKQGKSGSLVDGVKKGEESAGVPAGIGGIGGEEDKLGKGFSADKLSP